MKTRVYITGIGAVTPIGIGQQELWAGLHQPVSAIRRATRFDASLFHSHVAGEVRGFEPERWVPAKPLRRMDRFSRFSVSAAKMAVEDAGLDMEAVDRTRMGCFLGSSLGGVSFGEIQYGPYYQGGLRAVDPSLALTVFAGAGSCNIAMHLGMFGPTSANADGCASGVIAIGRAMQAIQHGEADVMIAGAAEAPLTQLSLGAYDLLGLASTHFNDTPERASRPFDRDHDGFVIAEGSAMLVLESEEHARNRGARLLAEVAGMAVTHDGHDMNEPRPDAAEAVRCMNLAISDAGATADEVDLLSLHGVAVPAYDQNEAFAVHQALGARAFRIAAMATKSRYGHPLGASGAIETAILALCLHHRWLPDPVNLDHPDPECRLNLRSGGPITSPVRLALNNTFAFGGLNACLALRPA